MSENTSTVFGIDLGTTYSCISYLKDGRAVVCQSLEGENTTPSVVRMLPEEETPVVGRTAKDMALIYPDHTIQFVKSKIGKVDKFEYGTEDDRRITTPVEVSAEILKKLASDAGAYTNTEVKDVVITVPAYFGPNEKDATREAGILAGLNVVDIVEEPTAAAFYYGCENAGEEEVICIFDLGGGTFDVTAMKMDQGSLRVLTTEGDHDLGGRRWDDELIAMVEERFRETTGYAEEFDSDTLQELQLKCEAAKKQLTNAPKAMIPLKIDKDHAASITITREEFDARTSPLLASAIEMTREVFDRIEERGEKIDKILLVGGSSFMPQVAEAIRAEFNMEPEMNEPNEAVSKGACIFCAWKFLHPTEDEKNKDGGESVEMVGEKVVLEKVQLPSGETQVTTEDKEGNKSTTIITLPPAIAKIKIISVATKSFGIKAFVDDVLKIVNLIKKDTELPFKLTQTFYTREANMTNISIELYSNTSFEDYVELYEGELLGDSILEGLPTGMPAEQPVEITFSLLSNGLIEITGSYQGTPLAGKLEKSYAEGVGDKEVKE